MHVSQNILLLLTAESASVYRSRIENNEATPAEESQKFIKTSLNTQDSEVPQPVYPDGRTEADFDELLEGLKKLCEKDVFEAQHIPRYLLPSAAGISRTTPVQIEIEYGATFQLVVAYATEDQIKKDAYEYVKMLGLEDTGTLMGLKEQFEASVSDEQRAMTDVQIRATITSHTDVKLRPEVQRVAGRVFHFAGDGVDFEVCYGVSARFFVFCVHDRDHDRVCMTCIRPHVPKSQPRNYGYGHGAILYIHTYTHTHMHTPYLA